ncbi:MAG: class I SAM-dependent rRNA methyltransferase [Clostridium sp.]|nr:class I SAM-dependent rRNA methyltransferase [Clostridium sp.]
MTNHPVITLRRGKEDSLLRFHPWVFSGAVEGDLPDLPDGTIVDVHSSAGAFLATGHYQRSTIAVRILSFEKTELDEAFFTLRLAEALRLRRALGLIRPDNTAFRLVHGEGDFLPGLIVDIYGDTAVVQAHSVGMHDVRRRIAASLTHIEGLDIANVYYKSETTLVHAAREEQPNGYLVGGNASNIAVENGLKFHIDWLKGQKTGFFVDQRDNRSLLERYSRGRRVLNMFCYTGGFSVYAMRGGAASVVSVDSSAKAVMLTDSNIALNFPGDSRHHSEACDAFDYLDRMSPGDHDLIILDPPAFAKHRGAIRNALRGYQRLNAKAFAKIAPGGILFTFSCSQAITREQFRLAVFSAATQSGRRVRILDQLSQPADHPVNIYHPEGEYLKGLVLYVE